MRQFTLVFLMAIVLSICIYSTSLADWSYTILPKDSSWTGSEATTVLGPDLQGGTAFKPDTGGIVDPSNGVIWETGGYTELTQTKSKIYDMVDDPVEGLYKVGQSGISEKAAVWDGNNIYTQLPGQSASGDSGNANSVSYYYDSGGNHIPIIGGEINQNATCWYKNTSGWNARPLSSGTSTVNDVKEKSLVGYDNLKATKWQLDDNPINAPAVTTYYMSGDATATTNAYSQAGNYVGGTGYIDTTSHSVAVLWEDISGVTENHNSITMHPDDGAILSEIFAMDQYNDDGVNVVVSGGWVGYLSGVPGVYAEINAALWFGPDNDYVNLHIPEYEATQINDIIIIGDTLYAVGTASTVNTSPYVYDSVLWTYAIPEPVSGTALIIGFASLVAKRRK